MANPVTVSPFSARPPHNTLLVRWGKFIVLTHPPLRYLILTLLWCTSLLSLLVIPGQPLSLLPSDAVALLSFYCILLYLRALDEIKDLDYDKIHKPDRPLVRGDLSIRDVTLLAFVIATLVGLTNLTLSLTHFTFVLANMTYAVFLLVLEKQSARFRHTPLLNLVVTFPVSAALNVYIWQHLLASERAALSHNTGWAIVAHMAVFLHFEFGRKLKWPQLARAGDNSYAQVLGMQGAMCVCVLLGAVACGFAMSVHWQAGASLWLAGVVWLSLLPCVIALRKLWRERSKLIDTQPLFMLSLPVFFLINVAVAVFVHSISFSS